VCHVGNGPTSPTNAQFIAAARTLLPRALATITDQDERLEDLRITATQQEATIHEMATENHTICDMATTERRRARAAEAEVQALTQERRLFPIQSERGAAPHPTRIPWSVADKAYSVYSAQYGKDQSLERLAERGGFGPSEMDRFHPTWREEASEILKLLADVAALTQERDALKRHIEIELLPDDPGGTKANWIARCHAAEAQLREQGMRAVSTPPEPYPPFEGTEVREEIPTDE
jgi:hypothetical protein